MKNFCFSNIRKNIKAEIEENRMAKQNALQKGTVSFFGDIFQLCDSASDFNEFEEKMHKMLMKMGLLAAEFYLAQKRSVPSQKQTVSADGKSFKYEKEKSYEFRCIFGQGTYYSSQYIRKKRELNLLTGVVGLIPAGGLSTRFALSMVNLCTMMSIEKAQKVMQLFLPYVPSTRSFYGVIDLLGQHAEHVQDKLELKGGEVAYIQVDSRCAPRIRAGEYQKRCKPHKKRGKLSKGKNPSKRQRVIKKKNQKPKERLTRGKKAKHNKQITVGLIYTLCRGENGCWIGDYGQFVARDQSVESVFKWLRKKVDKIKENIPDLIFLSDGAPCLRRLQLKYFPEATMVVDFYHVSEYLWSAGKTIYPEGSKDLKNLVSFLKSLLISGEIFEALSVLYSLYFQIPLKGPGTKGRRKRMMDAIRYIDKRAEQMPYKELLNKGLEIGSGAIEGAVRQIVALRCDGPGMRWGDRRIQLVLNLVCLRISEGWEDFACYINNWSKQMHQQQRMTPPGVNEKRKKEDSNKPDYAKAA